MRGKPKQERYTLAGVGGEMKVRDKKFDDIFEWRFFILVFFFFIIKMSTHLVAES